MNTLLALLVMAAPPSEKLPSQAGLAWPEFRGPTHEGHALGPAPLSWTETENVRWKTPLPGLGWSSPTVAGRQVVLTTAVEAGGVQELRLLIVDLDDGSLAHNVLLFEQGDSPLAEMHQKNSHASPTPVLARRDDGRVVAFVHFGPHGTAAVLLPEEGSEAAPETLWKAAVPAYLPQHGTGGSPALHGTPDDGVLIICGDGRDVQYVVGLDAATGEQRWKTDRNADPDRGFSFGTPLLIPRSDSPSGVQAICPGSSTVMSLDPETGEEFWRSRYGSGYSVVPRPVFDPNLGENGLVFLSSGFGDKTVYAIDPSGTGDVTDTHVAWSSKKQAPYSPSLLLHEGLLYTVSDGGIAFCRDAESGDVEWTDRLDGKFSASPLLVTMPDGSSRIYWQDEGGRCTVTLAGRKQKVLGTNELPSGDRTFASYALVEGDFLIRSEKLLYRIGE